MATASALPRSGGPPVVHPRAQLARLIAQQAADARLRRLPGTHEVDLAPADEPGRPVLDRIADPRAVDPAEAVELLDLDAPGTRRRAVALPYVIAGLSQVWSVEFTRYTPQAGECPGCHDRPPPAGCAVCSRTSDDRRAHPAQGTPPPLSARVRKTRSRSGKVLAGGTGTKAG